MTHTAEDYRRMAREARARAAESFERCDTDGFLTQGAAELMAREYDLRATLADDGNIAEFPALFDLDGNLIAAKYVHTRYGYAWGLLPSDDTDERFAGWFNPSKASNKTTARKNNARKGYYTGKVAAKATVVQVANGILTQPIVVRCDGGFSRDVQILDNGH